MGVLIPVTRSNKKQQVWGARMMKMRRRRRTLLL
jgi:hypothetical protein